MGRDGGAGGCGLVLHHGGVHADAGFGERDDSGARVGVAADREQLRRLGIVGHGTSDVGVSHQGGAVGRRAGQQGQWRVIYL